MTPLDPPPVSEDHPRSCLILLVREVLGRTSGLLPLPPEVHSWDRFAWSDSRPPTTMAEVLGLP